MTATIEHANDLSNIPAAACPACGGWTNKGGMSQYADSDTPVSGRTGCVCLRKRETTPETEAAIANINIGGVTINAVQELYVIPSYDRGKVSGYSCLGFDYLLQRANAVADWLIREGQHATRIPAEGRGTPRAYASYLALMSQGSTYNRTTGKRCDGELEPQLIGLENKRVEVTYNDGRTERFWVGKSCGWMPCHLEVKRRDSTGGGATCGPYKSVRVVSDSRRR